MSQDFVADVLVLDTPVRRLDNDSDRSTAATADLYVDIEDALEVLGLGHRAFSWQEILLCRALETVRMTKAVPIRPATAALKAVLVRARMLVVISDRKLAVSSRRFVQVIMVFTLVVLVPVIVWLSQCACQGILVGTVTGA
jgi:hypothetical protein